MREVIYILLLFLTIYGFSEGIEFSVEVTNHKIPYKPIDIIIEIKNNTNKIIMLPAPNTLPADWGIINFEVMGELDYSCYIEPPVKEWASSKIPLESIMPNKIKSYRYFGIGRQIGIINPGHYEIKVIFNTKELKKPWSIVDGEKIKWESEWISIDIDEVSATDIPLIEDLKKTYPNRYKCYLLEGSSDVNSFILEKYPTSTYAGWALKDYVYKTYDYDEEGRKNEERKYRDLIEIFVNSNKDFSFAGSLISKAAFISLKLDEINKACELFEKAGKLKWEVPTMTARLREKAINISKSTYEKLKKEGKCN